MYRRCEIPFGLVCDDPTRDRVAVASDPACNGSVLNCVPEWGHKVRVSDIDNPIVGTRCWFFSGGRLNRNGYGRVWCAETKTEPVAHRHLWERLYGPIPKGLVLNHLCFNRSCVNPQHLDPCTVRENTLHGAAVLFKKKESR